MISKEQEFTKLKIDGIFNLQNTAEEFNLNSAELVAFHNQFCAIHELLPLSLPKHVEYIYLPTQNFLERDKKLLKSTKLKLPHLNCVKTYGAKIDFMPKKLSMHYKVNVKQTEKYIEFKKEKTYLNNQEIEQTIEQLFEKAEQILYPLQISQHEKGGIAKIVNGAEINKRWKEDYRLKIVEYYQSETSDEILQKLDSVFKNINDKKDFLERNLFYKLFLLPIYQNYHQFSKQDNLKMYFSSISKEINYEISYTLEREFTRGEKIALRINGKEEETIFNKNAEKGEVSFLYKFDKDNHELFSITGFATTFHESKTYKIEFELYDLKNNS